MGFLGKLFGEEEVKKAIAMPKVAVKAIAQEQSIPPAKVGLDGKFDESGLAKRVAKALDDADVSDDVGLWVAQEDSVVVLRYNEDAKGVLEQAKQIAAGVDGATSVTTEPNPAAA